MYFFAVQGCVCGCVHVFLSGFPSVLLPVSPLCSGLNPHSWVHFSASSSTARQFQPTFCSSAPTVVTRTLLTHPLHVSNMQRNSTSYRSVNRKSDFQYYLVYYTNLSTDTGPSIRADPVSPGAFLQRAGWLSPLLSSALSRARPLSW